jgi:TetR/AcrR family transcriptional repressor of mexJK operon
MDAVSHLPRRTLVKRSAISEAATRLFLERGFSATSMDDVAAAAGVSKATLYKQFGDKRSLFETVVLAVTERAETIAASIESNLGHIDTAEALEPDLVGLAVAYASTPVVRLRRLVVAEAERFPELAATYFDGAPRRALDALASGFTRLDERGLLAVPSPDIAATQFAYLVLGPLLDRALFRPGKRIPRTEIVANCRAGVALFLAVYAADAAAATSSAC